MCLARWRLLAAALIVATLGVSNDQVQAQADSGSAASPGTGARLSAGSSGAAVKQQPASSPATTVPHHKHTNRLAGESSPYLLQHAHNPVDWYPWGPEAFAAARAQDRPIFLSVGYSTCYWCHVMERQCFEDERIAALMNRLFVNIKVDREERPDVDALYMNAVQLMTRHGGWPMSVWLTPDLKPFYGGTYFPPQDMHGRPGFPTILTAIDDAYRNRRAVVEQQADDIVDVLRQVAVPLAPRAKVTIDQRLVTDLVARSTDDYDPAHGGFGAAPKFPRETLLEFLLVYCRGDGNAAAESQISDLRSRILKQVLHTLDAMADGGIRDHLGGGFHRYSTDARWLVPHFEIMLYDNAMLAWCYVEAYRQTQDVRYAEVAREVFDFIRRDMTAPGGAFYTAFDAEVDAMEGGSYLWTKDQVESVLGAEDARLFNRVYGVDRGPNFADPHHGDGTPTHSILYLPQPLPKAVPDERDRARLPEMRGKLLAARKLRKQPLLDTKVITSWNALMVRALAHGGSVLQDDGLIAAAQRAADAILTSHRAADGTLYRTSRDGVAKHPGFLDDYAFLAQALLDLANAGGGERYRDEARAVAAVMGARFGDPDAGGFFYTAADAPDLIVRQKTAVDTPLPSGNAVAAMVMQDLGQPAVARDTLVTFAESLRSSGEGMSSLALAAHEYLRGNLPISVHPPATRPATTTGPASQPSPVQQAADAVQLTADWVSPTELRATVTVAAPYHVNAHEPLDRDLVPTQLAVVGEGIAVARIDYPPGADRAFAFSDRPLRVYDGTFAVTVTLRAPVPPGTPVRLSLQYQACDESACLAPVTRSITTTAP